MDGIMRVEVEAELINRFNALDGFSPNHSDATWMTVPAGSFTSTQLPNRRLVVVGTDDGAFEPEGMQRGAGPGEDVWVITCGLVCTTISDPIAAKQACQDALNQICAELARDHRLGMHGPHDLVVTRIEGPWFGMDKSVPTAWSNFDITANATIRRTP